MAYVSTSDAHSYTLLMAERQFDWLYLCQYPFHCRETGCASAAAVAA